MAGPLFADRVKESTTTTGTGTLTLAGAVTGFQSFSAIGNANSTYYCIYAVDASGNPTGDWEVGVGTYTTSGTTLSRTTVLASSNSGSAMDFAAGTKHVIVTAPANYGTPLLKMPTTHALRVANETALSSTLGNARGTGAVDLQTKRGDAAQVASGSYSILIGGKNSRASGTNSIAGGSASIAAGYAVGLGAQAVASGSYSVAMGMHNYSTAYRTSAVGGTYNAASAAGASAFGGRLNTASATYAAVLGGSRVLANKYGQRSQAGGMFAAAGDAQTSEFVLRNSTTNDTQTELFLNGSSERLTLANDTTWAFSILIAARRTDADGESAGYLATGVIDRQTNAASTALVGTITKTVLAEDSAGWDVDVQADATNGALVVKVTGEVAKTVRWVAFVRTTEVSG